MTYVFCFSNSLWNSYLPKFLFLHNLYLWIGHVRLGWLTLSFMLPSPMPFFQKSITIFFCIMQGKHLPYCLASIYSWLWVCKEQNARILISLRCNFVIGSAVVVIRLRLKMIFREFTLKYKGLLNKQTNKMPVSAALFSIAKNAFCSEALFKTNHILFPFRIT